MILALSDSFLVGFGFFVALSLVLIGFVVRFAVTIGRRDRKDGGPRS